MSTAALSAPHLEINAPDTMDLHSDNGIDFGEVDTDIDLHSNVGLDDDDVSVHDVTADSGLEMQTLSGDHDDFMADNEDLIDEDYADDGDVEVDLDVQLPELTDPAQSEPVPVEEDLIDYSDDEEPVVEEDTSAAKAQESYTSENTATTSQIGQAHVADLDASVVDNRVEDGNSAAQYAQNVYPEDPELSAAQDQHAAHGINPGEQDATQRLSQQQVDVTDVAENTQEAPASPQQPSPQADVPVLSGAGVASIETNEDNLQDVSAHPVTVNYDGAELWLFKHHDYESSGDYIVDNHSLANQPISAVLEACREALGSDISADLELGFRLDCFHSIELYQDHTSCAFITLDQIVRLYLQLHAQDGNSDPESFYMSIVFRPRVSSLLHDLMKAAAEGIGHSGLNNAILCGQTAFNAHYSRDSTEQIYDDWDNENDQEPTNVDTNAQHHEDAANNAEHVQEHDEEQDETHADAQEHYEIGGLFEQDEGEYVHASHSEHDEEQYELDEAYHEGREEEEAHASQHEEPYEEHQEGVAQQVSGGLDNKVGVETVASVTEAENLDMGTVEIAGQVSEKDEQSLGPQEDLIDYSDEEDEEETYSSQAPAVLSASASSTVQGDDAPQLPPDAEHVAQELQEGNEEASSAEQVVFDEAADEVDHSFLDQNGQEEYSYEEIDGAAYGDLYDGENVEYEGQALEGEATYNAEQAINETTNYLNIAGEHTTAPDDELTATAGVDGDFDQEDVDDGLTAVDDIVTLDDAAVTGQATEESNVPRSTQDEDEIDFDDDDDDVDSPALVAASAGADAVVASSTVLQTLSPQGRKRSIDEAGNDLADAANSSDAKRPRV